VFNAGTLVGLTQAPLKEILAMLRETYCGTIGAEYMYMSDIPQKRWIQQRLESVRSRPSYSAEQKRQILERLTAAETLERYLHARYVGQTRFSLEGGDTLKICSPSSKASTRARCSRGTSSITTGSPPT
jgi:2-oxoglutarate dehydrogenase E1 component